MQWSGATFHWGLIVVILTHFYVLCWSVYKYDVVGDKQLYEWEQFSLPISLCPLRILCQSFLKLTLLSVPDLL